MPVALIIFITAHSCKKDPFPEEVKIITSGISDLLSVSVKVKCEIVDLGYGITDYGIIYKTSAKPQEGGTKVTAGKPAVTGLFNIQITGLQSGVKYYACAYAEIKGGYVYGGELSFTTLALASLTTKPATAITTSGATLEATISSDGGAAVTDRGFYWRAAANPDTTGTKLQVAGTGTGLIAVNLTGLLPNTVYYYKAYAKNSVGTVFGSQVSFTTSIAFPSVTTTEISSNTGTTALSGGNITSDGGSPITARGVCWGTAVNPTTALTTKTSDETGTGSFTSDLTGLTPATTYYVRAYATNSAGTSYGINITFNSATIAPTVTTTAVTSITSSAAISGGNVTSTGGATVTARGVCWSTAENPTTDDSKTTNGSGTGSFTSNITDLLPGTTYYLRAYATNSVGTSYGENLSFNSLITTPTLTTSPVSEITANTATSGGNITSEGGAEITARGVCWSTSQNPTISDNKTTDGTGAGIFTTNITNLSPGVIYYVRGYATNSAGTTYGNEFQFATLNVPTLSTTNITGITRLSSIAGGNISSDGGAAINERGVCWSTSQNPTVSDNKTADGTGTGTFTSTITDLNPSTTYYVRAYATNSVGIGYGPQVSFTSSSGDPTSTVTDLDGNIYNAVIIGTQTWMVENLKTTKYNDSTLIPNVTDNTAWCELRTPAYCWYNNDITTFKDSYGALYNWYTVNTGKLCPLGWHVSTDAEWTTLTTYLGGENIAGGKLKENGTTHWRSPNIGATNETGFTALPAGGRNGSRPEFFNVSIDGIWWTATGPLLRWMGFDRSSVNSMQHDINSLDYGFSVRCVKD